MTDPSAVKNPQNISASVLSTSSDITTVRMINFHTETRLDSEPIRCGSRQSSQMAVPTMNANAHARIYHSDSAIHRQVAASDNGTGGRVATLSKNRTKRV